MSGDDDTRGIERAYARARGRNNDNWIRLADAYWGCDRDWRDSFLIILKERRKHKPNEMAARPKITIRAKVKSILRNRLRDFPLA